MTLSRAYVRAWRYYREDWPKILLSLLLVGLSTLASLAQPFPLAILIDSLMQKPGPRPLADRLFAHVAPHSFIWQIVILAASMMVLRAASELIGLGQGYFKILVGYN